MSEVNLFHLKLEVQAERRWLNIVKTKAGGQSSNGGCLVWKANNPQRQGMLFTFSTFFTSCSFSTPAPSPLCVDLIASPTWQRKRRFGGWKVGGRKLITATNSSQALFHVDACEAIHTAPASTVHSTDSCFKLGMLETMMICSECWKIRVPENNVQLCFGYLLTTCPNGLKLHP